MKMDWVFGMHKDIEIPKIKRQASQKHTFIYNMKMDWVFDLPEDIEIPKTQKPSKPKAYIYLHYGAALGI